MRFDIITLFPRAVSSYLDESVIKRARARKLLDVRIHDLRDFAHDTHKKVDDGPYGGGPGMVLRADVLARAIAHLKIKRGDKKTKIILFAVSGKPFTQIRARSWAKKYDSLILIAGRYEGIDERIKTIARDITGISAQEISIGPYVLTGGELPALVVVDAIARHIPGVLGREESLEEKRYGTGMPIYTRPETIRWKGKEYRVPSILLSGDHRKIDEWRKKHADGLSQ